MAGPGTRTTIRRVLAQLAQRISCLPGRHNYDCFWSDPEFEERTAVVLLSTLRIGWFPVTAIRGSGRMAHPDGPKLCVRIFRYSVVRSVPSRIKIASQLAGMISACRRRGALGDTVSSAISRTLPRQGG